MFTETDDKSMVVKSGYYDIYIMPMSPSNLDYILEK